MAQDLWGEEVTTPTKRKGRQTPQPTVTKVANCGIYGHAWEYFGITGLKQCSVCNIKGYCPVCTPIPPLQDAQPFFCTKHTPTTESMVSA